MKRLHTIQKIGMTTVSLDVMTAIKIAILAVPAALLLALAPQLTPEYDQELQNLMYGMAILVLIIIGILFIKFLVVSIQNLNFLFRYIYVLDRKSLDFNDAHDAASFVRAHIDNQGQYFDMLERIAQYQTLRCNRLQSCVRRRKGDRKKSVQDRLESELKDLESIHTIMGLI